jgi:hypothetical protein
MLRSVFVSILAASAGVAFAEPGDPPVIVKQTGATFTEFCTEEGSITLQGSNNDATFDGPCATVTIEGSGNKVHIVRTGAIVIDGDQNAIDWRLGVLEGSVPKVTNKGSGNTVITYDEALARQK